MNYFRKTATDWSPADAYISYVICFPNQNRAERLREIKKDLLLLTNDTGACGIKAKSWISKWKSISNQFKNDQEAMVGSMTNAKTDSKTRDRQNVTVEQTFHNYGNMDQQTTVNHFESGDIDPEKTSAIEKHNIPLNSGSKKRKAYELQDKTKDIAKKTKQSDDSNGRQPSSSSSTTTAASTEGSSRESNCHEETRRLDRARTPIPSNPDDSDGIDGDDIPQGTSALDSNESPTNSNDKDLAVFINWAQEFLSMSHREQLLTFLNNGKPNEVDLETLKISERKAKIANKTLKALKFQYAITKDEATWLGRIRNCRNLEELVALKADFFQKTNIPTGLEYIRTAVHHATLMWTTDKLTKDNNEDWWRLHLYAAMFDNVFLFLKDYDIKRSECGSTAIKEYEDLFAGVPSTSKQLKLDFALRCVGVTKHDIFTGEDKPPQASKKVVEETLEKNRRLRVMSLKVLSKKLAYPALIEEFTSLTALWHGNMLRVQGTKKVEDTYFHFEACRVEFPLNPTDFHAFSSLLLTVLSLKRHVIRNHQILMTIQQCLEDINMNNGSRSPMHLNEQDDSIELQQSDVDAVFDELKKEEDEHVKYCKDAISSLEFSDEDGSIILTTELSEYFKNAKPRDPTYVPLYNLYETDDAIIVHLDLPGVDIDTVSSSFVPPSTLKVTGSRKNTMPVSPAVYQCSFGPFERIIPLPKLVNPRSAHAKYECGILHVTLIKEMEQEIQISLESSSN